LAHLGSLKLYAINDSTADAEGPKLESTGVLEQRVTGLAIHSLIAAAIIYGRNTLRSIPVAVLTGLFLYLGASSVDKTDLWERSMLFFTDDRDVPKEKSWIKNVSIVKTKIFTTIQLGLLALMWGVKASSIGVFFPVLIAALAPVRLALERFSMFSKKELDSLDSEIA